ncbi:hypothetical protein [Chryseobacterium viscerum]|uniref:HNH domain-containing protein n=1 Tax=Chryseobacterium viscerum TaxID=1037377 RepID=A0A316WPN2_9FLAO|nr:hypothetical protein [Chryseobacterium viscerum]PWN61148.1 hypothetical protein C1634_013895 [Chryseobacterium viscerum]
MLYIPHPSDKTLTEYYDKVKGQIKNNITDSDLKDDIKLFLNNNLKNIIKSKPEQLKNWNDTFFSNYFNKLEMKYFNIYSAYVNANNRTAFQILLCKYFDARIKPIKKIFDYKNILSNSSYKSYWLSKEIDTNTCVYCNRLYANTIEVGSGSNSEKRIARPTFDHWFSQSKHPILALSFYNLIPSCSVCNSSIKGVLEFDRSTHLHPYEEDKRNAFYFSYDYKTFNDSQVIIKNFDKLNDKVKKTINDFKLVEVYNSHSDKELKDLLELRLKYSKNYIDTLVNKTFKGIANEAEVYRMIFGIEISEEYYHKRPFSKFKKDIIDKLLSIDYIKKD